MLNNEMIERGLHTNLPAGTVEKPVLVVIDEAVDFFDTEDRAVADREFLTFLRYSRKLCIDIIMIAQEFTELNKRIRNQVQWVWTFKDLGTERVPVLRIQYPPPYRYNIAGAQWSGRRYGNLAEEPVRVYMRWKDQRIFGCYKTEELFREVKVLRDVKTNFAGNITKGRKKMNKWERVALAACLVISVINTIMIKGKPDPDPVKVAEKSGLVPNQPSESSKIRTRPEQMTDELNQEYLIASLSGQSGYIITTTGKYEVGDYHQGNRILSVEGRGYLYQDRQGNLETYHLQSRPKVVQAQTNPTKSG
jgi:hypothetical protein